MSEETTPSAPPIGPIFKRRARRVAGTAPSVAAPPQSDVSGAPHTDLIENADPNLRYQLVNRSRVGRYLKRQTVGNDVVGYRKVAPWHLVKEEDGVLAARGRDDAGSPIDSAVSQGECVLIANTEEEAAKHDWAVEATAAAKEKAMKKGERRQYGNSFFRAAIGPSGNQLPQFLTQLGHQ